MTIDYKIGKQVIQYYTIESANFFQTFTLQFTIKPEIEKKIVKWQKSFPNILAEFLRTPALHYTFILLKILQTA